MLDLRTLYFAIILNDLVLAAALWVAIGAPSRRATGRWLLSLTFQAASFALFVVRGSVADPASIVGVNACAGLSFALQLAALLAFHGRRLPPAVYALAPFACGAAFGLLWPWARARMVLGGFLYGGVLCGIAGVAVALHRPGRRLGNGLLVAGCVGGGLLLLGRGGAALLRPDLYHGFEGAGAIPVVSVLVAQVTTLLASLGFLLMHRERHEEQIEQLAMTDPLTGAFNRRTLFDLGDQELARARRAGTSVSVVLLDVDHFKRVNDTLGHDAGDAVLRRFVEVLRGCLRKSDLLTRYGGEEFCVLLPGETLASARVLAERMRAAVAATELAIGGRTLRVTTSAGVASLGPERAEGLSWLMSRADEALYAAKRDGRDRVVAAGS